MKFYGTGIVWNPDKEKALCQFVKGEFDTEEQDIIERLIALGYKRDEVIETTSWGDIEPTFIDAMEVAREIASEPIEELEQFKPIEIEGFTDEELKAEAKLKGIKGYGIMKRETLIEKLKED
jgi:hypothetical protein